MTTHRSRRQPLYTVVITVLAMLGSLLPGAPAGASSGAPLTWAPPELTDPTTVNVTTEDTTIMLDSDRDYVIVLPSKPLESGLAIAGGRNVVIIGGQIRIPWQGDNPSIIQRRGLFLSNQTGVVHVEGLLITGEDLSEGIQIDAPEAVVQLQHIRVEDVHARDQVGFSDNHPDVIQAWGGVAELRIDRLTGSTDYQGLYLAASSGSIGRVDLRNVNIVGRQTSRYVLWSEGGFPRKAHNVYLQSAQDRGWAQTVWPSPGAWPGVIAGSPPGGDFVKTGTVGIVYTSSGYINGQSRPEPADQAQGSEEPDDAGQPDHPQQQSGDSTEKPTEDGSDAPSQPREPPSLQVEPGPFLLFTPFQMALCVISSFEFFGAEALLWVAGPTVRPVCLI